MVDYQLNSSQRDFYDEMSDCVNLQSVTDNKLHN